MTESEYLTHFETTYKSRLEAHPVFKDRYVGFYKIFKHLLLHKEKDFTIIETGTLRKKDTWTDGQSALLFYEFITHFGGKLISIDTDPQALATAREVLETVPKQPHASYELLLGDGVAMLHALDMSADLVYLDSFDLDEFNPVPSMVHHLKELASLRKIVTLSPGVLVAVDDNFSLFGKGKYVKEWALATKQEVIHDGYQFIFKMIE